MKMFGSDNDSGVHVKILEAICNCNFEHAHPYGNDTYTEKATNKFKEVFGEQADIFFVPNGTGANVIGLSSLLNSFEGVICAENAHINVDECGAFEKFTGSKLLQIPLCNDKIRIKDIETLLIQVGNEHRVQPKVISISQVSESGTVYTINEIKELADFAHKNELFLHVDGSRISNAAVSLNVTFKEMITDTGVDLLSFGGTKNGMMYGESIVSLNKYSSEKLKYLRKQGMQLISKMRYISAQFLEYFEDDLWAKNAKQANDMAKLLYNAIKDLDDINIISNVDANIVMATIPKIWIEPLQKKTLFYILDENINLVRWVMSYDTTTEDVYDFIDEIIKVSKIK